MEKRYSLLVFLFILSCKSFTCQESFKDYSNSLNYLKEHIENINDSSYSFEIKEISQHIYVLESTSKIEAEFGGDYVGKYQITENDINNWEKWLKEKCPLIMQ